MDPPSCNPDDSAAAVVQIFGEEGANAVAAAFFDGNAATVSGDAVCSSAPDQHTTDVDLQPGDDLEAAQESAKPSALEDTAASEGGHAPEAPASQDEPAVPLDPGAMEDMVADDANIAAVDATASEHAGAPGDNAAPTEAPVLEDAASSPADAEVVATGPPEPTEDPAAREELVDAENATSPAEAPEAEESPQPDADPDAPEVADASVSEPPPMTMEETPAGGEFVNAEPAPEDHVSVPEPAVDPAPEESSAPNDDPAAQAGAADDGGEPSSAEAVGDSEAGTVEV